MKVKISQEDIEKHIDRSQYSEDEISFIIESLEEHITNDIDDNLKWYIGPIVESLNE